MINVELFQEIILQKLFEETIFSFKLNNICFFTWMNSGNTQYTRISWRSLA